MTTDIPQVGLTDPLDRALDGLQKPDTPAVAVIDRRYKFLGYITRENIGEWAVLNNGSRKT